jgi:protein-S-isoprenylcysteine O-methyltransferase Ste14
VKSGVAVGTFALASPRSDRMPALTRTGLAAAFSNVALAAMYLLFARAHVGAFWARPRLSIAVVVAMETLFAAMILVRREARRTEWSLWAWVTTAGGTFVPLLLRPVAGSVERVVGEGLQIFGLTIVIAGMLALNRSFGLLPAHRGIRSSGPYRFVRHPLYAGYTVSNVGYLLSHPSASNAAIVAAAFAFQLLRIGNEERLLAADPEYACYAARTRWRVLPFVY